MSSLSEERSAVAPILFAALGALAPALLALDGGTFGPTVWHAGAVIASCAITGFFVGALISDRAYRRRKGALIILTGLFPFRSTLLVSLRCNW